MKRLYPALIVVFISVLAFHCQKEVRSVNGGNQPPNNNTNPNTTAPITATLQGNVVDENGHPAIGVTIKAGTKTTTTNARGYFRINDAGLDKNTSLVTADKSGYFKAYRSFSATSGVNQVMIKLIKKTSVATISASTGGNATLANGAVIILPANGVVKAAGSASYNGNINVYASYIDPTDDAINKIVPGSFMATDKDNKRVTLSSYGMLAVELESAAGEKLQLASGSTAKLTIPIPASIQSSAPASVSLWYVDEKTGIWKEEGEATKSGTSYTGEVKHFSYWNADVSGPTVGFSATLKDGKGLPMTFTHVRIKAASGYIGYAYGVTDSLGQVSGFIPANINLVFEILNDCNGVAYSQNIGPYSSSINLGTITVPASSGISILTIKGKIVNCSNGIVTNGYAFLNYDNVIRHLAVNSNGEFSVSFPICSATPSTCEIIATDVATQQQGSTTNVTITAPVTDAGTLTACGTSTLQFINYNLDGVSHSLSSIGADSILAYATMPGVTLPVRMRIMGSRALISNFDLAFDCSAAPGTYALHQKLYVQNYQRIGVIDPFNITFTSFPQTVGEYYEGGFTGQFRDSADLAPLHTINGSFRLVKNW